MSILNDKKAGCVQSLRSRYTAFIVAVITVFAASNVLAVDPIGNVLLIKGLVQSESGSGNRTLLAKGDDIYLEDTIRTADDGYIVLKMIDGTKFTLRPDSEVVLGEYSADTGSESASIELLKGGLRTITGSIGKNNPEAFQLSTPIATIGIRGTDFVARLCESHGAGNQCSSQCALEEHRLSSNERLASRPQAINGKSATGRTLTECEPLRDVTDGLYVGLYDGAVNVASKDEELDITSVVAARVEVNSQPECLIDIPNFLAMDPYFAE